MLANIIVENNKNITTIKTTILVKTSVNSSLMSNLINSILVSRNPIRFLTNFCGFESSVKIFTLG